jgi:PAS domain S-box-containing protein
VVRNTTGVIAIFPIALALPHLWRAGWRTTVRAITRGQWAEAVLLAVVTLVALWAVFDVNSHLPLPFVVITTCVWAGARFGPVAAASHSLLLATVVVVLSVHEHGPFANIPVGYERALVVQTYILVVVLVTLSLAVARREASLLTDALVESEQAAQAQARLMQAIVDSMADGVTVVDEQGRLVLRNPAAQRMLGTPQLTEHAVVAAAAYSFHHPDGTEVEPDETPFALARRENEVLTRDYVLRTQDAERTLEVTATPLDDAENPIVVMVYHDVTAERRERDELSSFAGVVAHDLLNPLTVVEGWTTTLAQDAAEGIVTAPDVQLGYLERIQRAGRRMRTLIDDLLAYTTARDLTINPVPVELTELVRDIALLRVEAAEATDGVGPLIEVGELPPVMGEPVLVRQVLDNLIGNAVKYVAPGVRAHIEVCAEPAEQPGFVQLSVSDNGIGIPAGQHTSVFETFHRAHREGYRGTGLGLSIVKRIVDRHGGSVSAADRPGGGTVVTLLMPAAPVSEERRDDDGEHPGTDVGTEHGAELAARHPAS